MLSSFLIGVSTVQRNGWISNLYRGIHRVKELIGVKFPFSWGIYFVKKFINVKPQDRKEKKIVGIEYPSVRQNQYKEQTVSERKSKQRCR